MRWASICPSCPCPGPWSCPSEGVQRHLTFMVRLLQLDKSLYLPGSLCEVGDIHTYPPEGRKKEEELFLLLNFSSGIACSQKRNGNLAEWKYLVVPPHPSVSPPKTFFFYLGHFILRVCTFFSYWWCGRDLEMFLSRRWLIHRKMGSDEATRPEPKSYPTPSGNIVTVGHAALIQEWSWNYPGSTIDRQCQGG